MAVLILITLIILCVITINTLTKDDDNYTDKLMSKGYKRDRKIYVGKYVSGHPDINNAIPYLDIYSTDTELQIVEKVGNEPIKKAVIKNTSIIDVLAEDQSTIEKRITLGRVLLTGIFALAWKKKKKVELAYLTIEWNDGRFKHDTIFEFEGAGALEKANTARNAIIKIV